MSTGLMPLLLVGGMLLISLSLGISVVFLMRRFAAERAAKAVAAPLTTRAARGQGVEWFVFGIFTVVGLVLLAAFLIVPLIRVRQARHWVATPCVIESSAVRSNHDSDGTTYRPHITYRYRFQEKDYAADRYDFLGGWSSGRAGKQAVVDRYPAGLTTNCWVNPRAPEDAVLRRGVPGTIAFGLIPLVFVAIGAGGLLHTIRKRRRPVTEPVTVSPAGVPGEPVGLRPAQSRFARAFGALGVAVFWNGISWPLFFSILKDRDWVGIVFLSLFVLIGLVLLAAAGYCLLALANPRPILTLASGPLRHGPPQTLSWRFTGAVSRLRRLTITLVGREVATYTRGTNRVTETAVFAREVVFTSEMHSAIRVGEASVVLPAVAPPGFVADNNRVEWVLKVEGAIPFWPDVDEDFAVEVAGTPPPSAPLPSDLQTGEVMTHSPDGTMALGTERGRLAYLPGEMLTGAAGWSLPAPPTSAEVRLFWHTAGKGTRDVRVVMAVPLDGPGAQDTRSFSLVLPTLPWSLDGRLVSLLWGIELVLEPGGRNVRRELIVSPDGAPAHIANSLPDDNRMATWKRWFQSKR